MKDSNDQTKKAWMLYISVHKHAGIEVSCCTVIVKNVKEWCFCQELSSAVNMQPNYNETILKLLILFIFPYSIFLLPNIFVITHKI